MIEVNDRVQAAAELDALTRHPGWAKLLDYLRDQRESERRVLEGRDTSTARREAAAGEIRGLTTAINGPQALIERWKA